MFRSIHPQQLKGKIQEINSYLSNSIDNSGPLKTSIENFIGETELEGNAYMTQKEYMKEGHLPAIEAQVCVEELLKAANEKYIGYIDTYFSNETYLNEDLLQLQIATLTASKYTTNPAILFFIEDTINSRIEECRTKLNNMNSFIDATNGLFEDVTNQIDIAKSKVDNLQMTVYNAENGMYYMPSELTERTVSKDDFINNMITQYGFDDKTGEIMWNLYKKLKDKYPDASQKDIDWMFSRLLGGFIYDEDDSKIMNSFWSGVAGVADNDILGSGNEEFITSVLGISPDDYKYLRYKVRIQHQISGGSLPIYENIEPSDKDKYIENMCDALGINLSEAKKDKTPEEFEKFKEDLWNNQYYEMNEKCDFAHKEIIVSSLLSSNKLGGEAIADYIPSFGLKEEFCGWLGDAGLPQGKPLTTSLGKDDYIADLDSENIVHIMKTENKSYIEAQEEYYNDIKNGKYTRAEKFKEHTSIEEVKIKIASALYGPTASAGIAGEAINSLLSDRKCEYDLKHDYPESYNFIKNLEAGNNELKDYINEN